MARGEMAEQESPSVNSVPTKVERRANFPAALDIACCSY